MLWHCAKAHRLSRAVPWLSWPSSESSTSRYGLTMNLGTHEGREPSPATAWPDSLRRLLLRQCDLPSKHRPPRFPMPGGTGSWLCFRGFCTLGQKVIIGGDSQQHALGFAFALVGSKGLDFRCYP
jgi:hypothetical protein